MPSGKRPLKKKFNFEKAKKLVLTKLIKIQPKEDIVFSDIVRELRKDQESTTPARAFFTALYGVSDDPDGGFELKRGPGVVVGGVVGEFMVCSVKKTL